MSITKAKRTRKKRKYNRRKYSTRYDEDFFKKEYKPRLRTREKTNDFNANSEITILPSFNQIQVDNNSPYLNIASPILDALYEIVNENQ